MKKKSIFTSLLLIAVGGTFTACTTMNPSALPVEPEKTIAGKPFALGFEAGFKDGEAGLRPDPGATRWLYQQKNAEPLNADS